MTRGANSDGGGAVAQPGRSAARLRIVCLVVFALTTLGLGLWAGRSVLQACGGAPAAPLDDSYIHFQFARGFALLRPLEYVAGEPKVAGATSLLWPAILALPVALGSSTGGLILTCWLLGFGSLFGQAYEAYMLGRRFMSPGAAVGGGLLVLCFSANTWFAASGMEVVPLGYLLLRSARRAAEFLEGARTPSRTFELLALAVAATLLRPEGILGAAFAAVALTFGGLGRARAWGLGAIGASLLPALFSWALTGSAAQTTTLVKWLPFNPYFDGRLLEAVGANVQLLFSTLLDGRGWSWAFIPEGYRAIALAGPCALVLLALQRTARAHALFLALIALGLLIPATYDTFLVNRLRYLWPFSAPWLMGLAALGDLAGQALAKFYPRLRHAGLLIPGLCGLGFIRLAPVAVDDLALSAQAITGQQVWLGQWAARALPKDAKIGVNDAGAVSYYSGRPTFDVVGLTTRGEAKYWVAGPGSRFEHYERLPTGSLPTHFIVYPEWFGIPSLLGEELAERVVHGATILGGTRMVAFQAHYDALGSASAPASPPPDRPLLDALDVADLESEASHDYELGLTTAQENLVVTLGGRTDGGRKGRQRERFRLRIEGLGLIVVRLGSESATELRVELEGKPALTLPVPVGAFQEVSFETPAGIARGRVAVALSSPTPLTLLHYWSYAARAGPR